MKRHETLAAVSALLVALSCFSAVPAGAQDVTREEFVSEIRKLKDELATLRKLRELDNKLTNAELRLMNERLDRIEQSLARLAPTVTTRAAGSFTPTPIATGNVRLDNRLPVTAMVTIDGMMYTVPPLGTRIIRNRPAGSLVYEVTADGYGIRPPVRTPLAANETLTLTIY
jgi:hypothetical protein